MKILVCITHVPDTTSKVKFTEEGTKFDKEGVQFIIGPYDDYALAKAVELKNSMNAHVTAINVGLSETEPTLRKALAIGADEAVRVDAEPLDSFFVAMQIAAHAEGYDLILMGRESIDYNSGLVHGMVAELLGLPFVSPVMKLDIADSWVTMEKEIEGGTEGLKVQLPLVVGCQEPIAEWKIPNMRGIMSARSKPLTKVDPKPVETIWEIKKYATLPEKKGVKMISAENIDELVRLLQSEAKIL